MTEETPCTVFDDAGIGSDSSRTVVPAVVFAWAANMNLLSAEVANAAPLTRLKMRDVSFCDGFVTTCAGVLSEEHVSPALGAFLRAQYPAFKAYAEQALQAVAFDERQPWLTYDALAPWLTERWLGKRASLNPPSLLSRLTGWLRL